MTLLDILTRDGEAVVRWLRHDQPVPEGHEGLVGAPSHHDRHARLIVAARPAASRSPYFRLDHIPEGAA